MKRHLLILWAAGCVGVTGAEPSLRIEKTAADQITLSWDASGLLELASRLAGPWEVVASASGWTTKTTDQAGFFRLRLAYPLEVEVTGEGAGHVTLDPPGMENGETDRRWFDPGATVTLTAVAEDGSQFAGWEGTGETEDTLVVQMDQARSVTAVFDPQSVVGLVNGDFEQGGEGWIQLEGDSDETGGDLIPANPPLIVTGASLGIPAYSGDYLAWLGYASDNRHVAVLGQYVTLPATPPLYLHVSVWIHSQEMCEVGFFDLMGLYINGEALSENDRLCQSDTTDEWNRYTMDISSYAGSRIELVFRIFSHSYDPLASYILLDDIVIDNNPW
jgi:hypothetical protein